MKACTRIISVAAALLLLLSLLPTAVFAASGDDVLRLGREALGGMPNGAALQYAYDRLETGLAAANATISLQHAQHKISWEELDHVYFAVRSDHPEIFWLGKSYEGSLQGSVVASVIPAYTMTGSALQNAKTALENKVSSLLHGLDGKSQYEKSLLLHDRLAAAVDYVQTPYDQNAYGALVEGRAVCAGYARAYQLLMQRAGMPAWTVTGSSRNPATGNNEAHEWNLVRIDNEWYYTDVTWDDQGSQLYHAYFNLTSAQINEGHTPERFTDRLPDTKATAANYFVKNQQVYSGFDVDRLVNALKAGNNTVSLYVTGDSGAFLNSFTQNLDTVLSRLEVASGSGYSYSYGVLGHEVQLTLSIIPPGHRHQLTAVAKLAPTCSAKGHTAYYACDECKKWFEDAGATKEIVNKATVELTALAHTPSGWKSDTGSHWKECSRSGCAAVIADSQAAHADKDVNGKCDVCAAKVAIPASGSAGNANNAGSGNSGSGNNSGGSNTGGNNAGGNAGGNNAGGNSGGNSSGGSNSGGNNAGDTGGADNTTGADGGEGSDGAEGPADSGASGEVSPEENAPGDTSGGDTAGEDTPARAVPVWPIVGGVAVVGAGVATGVVLYLRKRDLSIE